jgi:ribonuclease P protein component
VPRPILRFSAAGGVRGDRAPLSYERLMALEAFGRMVDVPPGVPVGVQTAALRGAERFGRDRRLRSASEFTRVRKDGHAVSGAYLTLISARQLGGEHAQAVQPQPPTRVGFVIGKRVGHAVARNRVRRRLRELIRRRWAVVASGWDLVIVARPTAVTADSAALADELDKLLARAKVLAPGSEGIDI